MTWPQNDEERAAFKDWQYEVANGDTHIGFRGWLNGKEGTPPEDPDKAVTAELDGVAVTITHSAGSDGAIVVFIDTEFEPDASDGGPGLRVQINDDDTYKGVKYTPREEKEE